MDEATLTLQHMIVSRGGSHPKSELNDQNCRSIQHFFAKNEPSWSFNSISNLTKNIDALDFFLSFFLSNKKRGQSVFSKELGVLNGILVPPANLASPRGSVAGVR